MVADSLLKDEDKDIKRIGHQLYPFTSAGQYGKYFVGKNNIDFKNPFTVLELSRLESSEHLKQVVLLQLIYQIQQDMFMGDRSQMKLVIIDEAWALLSGNIGAFIEKVIAGSVNITELQLPSPSLSTIFTKIVSGNRSQITQPLCSCWGKVNPQ
jgi:hypothetical protein